MLTKFLKNTRENCKITVLHQKWDDWFLLRITSYIEKIKTKPCKKNTAGFHCEKCMQKIKLKNIESIFLLYMDFLYSMFLFIHWQMSYLPLFYPKKRNGIYSVNLLTAWKQLLAKAIVNYLLCNIMITLQIVSAINCSWWIGDQTT